MKTLAIVLLLAATVTGQEPTESDLRSKVADIAALSVRNTDDIQELRYRVAGLESSRTEIIQRLTDIENKLGIGLPISAPVVEYIAPVVRQVVPVVTRTKTVTRQMPISGGRTFRTPVRSFLGRLLRRRFVTAAVSRSSGDWTWPGDLDAHLQGPPHYVSAYELSFMSFRQKVDRHNQDHGG